MCCGHAGGLCGVVKCMQLLVSLRRGGAGGRQLRPDLTLECASCRKSSRVAKPGVWVVTLVSGSFVRFFFLVGGDGDGWGYGRMGREWMMRWMG